MTTTSVIVPTRGRCGPLRTCIGSLAAQREAGEFDVVVVDDAPTPDPVVAALVAASPLPIRLVHGGGRGAAAARNLGARACSGELLVFLDGDVEAPPGWLAAHRSAHAARDGEVAVVGPPVPVRSSGTLAERGARAWWLEEIRVREQALADSDTDVLTGNLSLPRALFERLGGFDEAFGVLRREDWELGARLSAAGVAVVGCPQAAALHDLGTTTASRLLGAEAEGAGDRLIARTHPEMVPALAARTPTHPPGRRVRTVTALWRRRSGRRVLLAVLDGLERAHLVRAWLSLFNTAQETAWRSGAGPTPYGHDDPGTTTVLELGGEGALALPGGSAGPVDVLWHGRRVGRAVPRTGRYGPGFAGELADQIPADVLLAPDAPPPSYAVADPARLAELVKGADEELVVLTCDGSLPPAEWVTRAAVALDVPGIAMVANVHGVLGLGWFELHSRRTRRVPHTLLGMPPRHLLARPRTLAGAGIPAERLLVDAGPYAAALDLVEQTLARGMQVGLLTPTSSGYPASREAACDFWHARGVLEARDAADPLSYVRRHGLGSGRKIARTGGHHRAALVRAYLRGLGAGRARRAARG